MFNTLLTDIANKLSSIEVDIVRDGHIVGLADNNFQLHLSIPSGETRTELVNRSPLIVHANVRMLLVAVDGVSDTNRENARGIISGIIKLFHNDPVIVSAQKYWIGDLSFDETENDGTITGWQIDLEVRININETLP